MWMKMLRAPGLPNRRCLTSGRNNSWAAGSEHAGAAVRRKILCRAKESGTVRADSGKTTMVQCPARFIFCFTIVASLTLASAENWPGWRGPRGDGTSLETNAPVHWMSRPRFGANLNIFWKTEIPGDGHASPIVWADRIFTVSARLDHQDRILLCVDGATGKIRWEKTVLESPLEKKHSLNSYASSTPVSDGKQVYVAFLDRQEMVVAAYDFEGNQK